MKTKEGVYCYLPILFTEKTQQETKSFIPANEFGLSNVDHNPLLENKNHSPMGLCYEDAFREIVFPFMNEAISLNESVSLKCYGKPKYFIGTQEQEYKGFFLHEEIKPFALEQFWVVLYFLCSTRSLWSENSLLGTHFRVAPEYSFFFVVLPNGINKIITIRPYTAGNFTEEYIGIQFGLISYEELLENNKLLHEINLGKTFSFNPSL
jgi:hypothetical protein